MSEALPPAKLRASDADRERVFDVLRTAVQDGRLDLAEFDERADRVHAARTLGDLPPILQDLLPPEAQPIRLDVQPVNAFFRNDERRGRWVVPGSALAFAMFGTADIDLRDALLARRHVRMTASALFGRIYIQVPEGVAVRMTGWSFLGRRATSARQPQGAEPPVLEIRGFSLFGTVRVSAPKRERRFLRRRKKPPELG